MLGNKALSKAVLKVTEEGAKQFKLVADEIGKLSNITGQAWCLTSAKLFDKVRKISFGQGFIGGVAFTGIVSAVRKRKKKDETKTNEE